MMWFALAGRNILANIRRSGLGLAAIALAACILVLFGAYVNAIRVGLQYATIHGGTGNFQVSGRGGFDSYADEPLKFGLTPADRAKLEKFAGETVNVRRTVPRLQFGGLVSNGPRTLSFAGTGVDPVMESAAFGSMQNIIRGSALRASSPSDGVVLGAELARRLGVKPGDLVTVLSPTVTGALNAMDMSVVGIESTGIPETDLFLLQAKLPAVQSLLATSKISTLTFLLENDALTQKDASSAERVGPNLEARTWLRLTPIYQQIVDFYETIFKALGTFIVVLTLMGLAIIILTGVLERVREIGIMRSLGISRRRVRISFVLEGTMLAIAGLMVGTALAAVGDVVINAAHMTAPPPPGRTMGYPLNLLWDWLATVLVWVAILLLSIVVSWFASGRAAKLKVIEALGTL